MKEQKKTSSSTVKVNLTLEWEFTQREYEDAKKFIKEQGWKWDNDPVTAVHFLNEMCWPSITNKKVTV